MATVLIVEDDQAMAVALSDGFSYEGFESRSRRTARRACASPARSIPI